MHTTREEQNLRQISKSVELKDASWKNHHTSQQIPNQIPPIAFSTAVSTVRTNPNFESISKLHQVQQLQPASYKPNESYISVVQSSQQKGSVLEKTSVCSPYETLIRTSLPQSIGGNHTRRDQECSPSYPHYSANSMVNSSSMANGQGLPLINHQQSFRNTCIQPSESATSFSNPAERSTAVSRDRLSKEQQIPFPSNHQRMTAHEHANQQRAREFNHQRNAVPSQQASQWIPKRQNMPTQNNFGEGFQEYNHQRPSQQRPSVFENRMAINEPLPSSHHHYPGQQFPQPVFNASAFNSFHAEPLRPSTTPQVQLQTNYCLPTKPMEAKSTGEIGRYGVSVIQHPTNIRVGDTLKPNETRMSVISNYSSKCNINVITPKIEQDQSALAQTTIPKQQVILGRCDYQTDSARQQNLVGIPVKISRKPNQPRDSKKPLLKLKHSSEKLMERTPTVPEVLPVDSTLEMKKSDPIVSDEKWEEWKSSFDVEWNAFITDLTVSENIKRVYR